jgi:leucyl aminopeptidase
MCRRQIIFEAILAPESLTGDGPPTPIHLISALAWPGFVDSYPERFGPAAALEGFAGASGEVTMVASGSEEGSGRLALVGLGDGAGGAMALRGLPGKLPPGAYVLAADVVGDSLSPSAEDLCLAWALGAYRFDRYKRTPGPVLPRLIAPPGVDLARIEAIAGACGLVRDMINTPANDMGPAEIEAVARDLAGAHGAALNVIVGDALLTEGYPAVHAVGRAAVPSRAPRMIELTWGDAGLPLVALVGKGVAFDTGGLDIKPSAGMRLMKKDMGGAAHALGLARMIMALRLPVRLAVLIPAVENAISGDAMRPGDVLASRSGLSIEVGNTDAEGRLVLADALTRASELGPDLTIDLATLTGAARVALGPQVMPFFTDDDGVAAALASASTAVEDPLWRMPLWRAYAPSLESDVADIKNDSDGWAQAGAVTAALFLQRFAPKGAWVHLDIFAWNPRGRPGWPVGGEAQAIRAILAMLEARYR